MEEKVSSFIYCGFIYFLGHQFLWVEGKTFFHGILEFVVQRSIIETKLSNLSACLVRNN